MADMVQGETAPPLDANFDGGSNKGETDSHSPGLPTRAHNREHYHDRFTIALVAVALLAVPLQADDKAKAAERDLKALQRTWTSPLPTATARS